MTDPRDFGPLLNGGWRELEFEPFREGVDVHYLWDTGEGPVWAFLRYAAGAAVPTHLHTGLETILVVEGSQSDEHGRYPQGSMICNPPGSKHSVWSVDGCVVLIQWEKPVIIL